jgi:NAD(P)-dependent dehydrogenase (short-subunit alcohol dehydrogenase family)
MESELELKRPLWVIGAKGGNLGGMVAKVASDDWYYKEIIVTDTEVDVCNQEKLVRFVAEIRKSSPETGIDIAYCAGVNILDAIMDVDEVNLYQTFNVNVMGFIRVMQALERVYYPGDELPMMTRQTRSNVVAVASDAARVPMRRSITYCASKAALVQAVRVAARELAPFIRVNSVSPGIIDETPMTDTIDREVMRQRSWTRDQQLDYERSSIPMGRRGHKGEVADLILHTLLGPVYMTGSNIEINGGK